MKNAPDIGWMLRYLSTERTDARYRCGYIQAMCHSGIISQGSYQILRKSVDAKKGSLSLPLHERTDPERDSELSAKDAEISLLKLNLETAEKAYRTLHAQIKAAALASDMIDSALSGGQ